MQRATCVKSSPFVQGRWVSGLGEEEVIKKVNVHNSPQKEMCTQMVQLIEIIRLTSRVAKDCKPRSEHDENGEADAKKGGVRGWGSTVVAT